MEYTHIIWHETIFSFKIQMKKKEKKKKGQPVQERREYNSLPSFSQMSSETPHSKMEVCKLQP